MAVRISTKLKKRISEAKRLNVSSKRELFCGSGIAVIFNLLLNSNYRCAAGRCNITDFYKTKGRLQQYKGAK
jgi:HKD family nuclease